MCWGRKKEKEKGYIGQAWFQPFKKGKEGELTNIKNKKLEGEGLPEDWRCSTTIPIYKGKGDAMECRKYRGVRLRIWNACIQRCVKGSESWPIQVPYQFGFYPSRSTAGAILV